MAQTYFQSDFTGSKREHTHEGFLLCRDVRVARTGEMLYADGEVPVPPDVRGLVKINRGSDVLFDPITLESGLGKSVTIQHPEDDVDPINWKEHEVGTVLSCREGKGADSDFMLMDFMVKDGYAIQQIEQGLVEISLGYDAKYHYEQDVPGVGWQTDMIINHAALVPKGRCGKECAIRDNATVKQTKTTKEGKSMARNQKSGTGNKALPRNFKQLFRDAFRTSDAAEFEEILDAAAEEWESANVVQDDGEPNIGEDPNEVHIHLDGGDDNPGGEATFADGDIQAFIDKNEADHSEFRKRLEALERAAGISSGEAEGLDGEGDLEQFLEDEAPEDVDPQEVLRTNDSRYLVDSLQQAIALAEIIAPGISVPTVDSAAPRNKTASSICSLRKKALRIASTNDCAAIVDELTNGKGIKTGMTCDAARTLFNAVAAQKRSQNRSGIKVRDSLNTPEPGISRQPSIREINEFNRQKWGKK